MEEKQLRFAPLIRVSTEDQKARGHSLEVQENTVLQAVNAVNGVIPDDCWEYSGQEHATINYDRKKFTKLLADCATDKFDAIIVADPSRWSRDNLKSKEGLNILKQHGIRFFVGSTEYDLFNPQATLFLGMSTEMNEFFALEQSRKSILSRIERAKKNMPSAGKLPFGRTFDKQTRKWGIDEEKKRDIVWAADQYLVGVGMSKIAKTLGMNHSNLWKVLNHRSGTKWVAKFKDDRLRIDETITLNMPALLPEETIDAIHAKAKLNKKYDRKIIKNRYLLARMVYCAECGLAMFGQANSNKRLYYRHSRNGDGKCSQKTWSVPAGIIEDAVFFQIYSLIGDEEKLEKAIKKAVPDRSIRKQMEQEIATLKTNLKSINAKKSNLLNAVADGVFVADDVKSKMDVLREQEKTVKEQIAANNLIIKNIPSEEELKIRTVFAQNMLNFAKTRYLKSVEHLCKMPWEDKRKLLESVFLGVDKEGRRDGVYVKKKGKTWHYEIRGSFIADLASNQAPQEEEGNIRIRWLNRNEILRGKLPLTREDVVELLQLDPDSIDAQLDLLSKCHAYHCIRFYK